MSKKTLTVILLTLLNIIIFGVLGYFLVSGISGQPKIENQKPVACTNEAKICPDGSAVGRAGPKCEFASCPVNNFDCKENPKYLVISKNNNYLSSDFLVKYKTSKDQIISCSYIVGKTDFELKNQGNTSFLALTNNFLILDYGTAPPPRGLIVYDLNTRKEVYTDIYSGPISTSDDVITYWSPTKEKPTNENCPQLDEWLKHGLDAEIEGRVDLNLSNLDKKELGEYRCSPVQ